VWGLYQLCLTRATSTLFFHLPRVCVPTEKGPVVGSSPRPVDYCSTRVGIRTKNGAHAPTSGTPYLATMNDQSSNAIHPIAWNRNSRKFAVARRRWHYAPQKKVLVPRASAIPAMRLPMRIVTGLLIVAVAMLVAVGGLVVVQRLVSTERRKQHNDVAGFIYAVLGVSYAALLGLMLVAVWEQWDAAEALTTDEANELAGIFWWAHALPQPEGLHIQELVRSYAEVVVEEEWPLMAQGRSSPKAWATLDELRGTILGLKPPKGGAQQLGYDQARYSEMLVQLHDLGNARRERLLAARQGLPPILWVVLILGGVITVGFTYLFGLENTLGHLLMVAALALIISISLFTVAALDYPFNGDIRIHPAAYEQDLERFHESKLSDL
jgi:hypothetical protein